MAQFLLRLMTQTDLLPTFLMRNDAEVCRFAQIPNPISWNEHEAMFKYTDFPKFVYVGPHVIGYVEFRHDIYNDDPTVKIWAFMIDALYRGAGLSEPMLKAGLEEVKKLGVKKVWGIVKKDNPVSIHLHKKLNGVILKEDDENYTFELTLS